MRDFITRYGKNQRIAVPFARDSNLYRGAPGPSQKIGDFRRGYARRGFVVDFYDHVAGPDSGLVGWSAYVGRHHDCMVSAGNHRHAHTIVSAADLLPVQCPLASVEEIGMGIEHAQHPRDSALLNDFVDVPFLPVTPLPPLPPFSKISHRIFAFAL